MRACYIELIPEMRANHFVFPDIIYSNNAKSFIAGVHFMEKVFTSNEFKQRFGVYEIKHIRIPLYSPW